MYDTWYAIGSLLTLRNNNFAIDFAIDFVLALFTNNDS